MQSIDITQPAHSAKFVMLQITLEVIKQKR